MKRLIIYITNKNDLLQCPDIIKKSEIQSFNIAAEEILISDNLLEKLQEDLAAEFKRLSSWIGQENILEKTHALYQKAMNKLYA